MECCKTPFLRVLRQPQGANTPAQVLTEVCLFRQMGVNTRRSLSCLMFARLTFEEEEHLFTCVDHSYLLSFLLMCFSHFSSLYLSLNEQALFLC